MKSPRKPLKFEQQVARNRKAPYFQQHVARGQQLNNSITHTRQLPATSCWQQVVKYMEALKLTWGWDTSLHPTSFQVINYRFLRPRQLHWLLDARPKAGSQSDARPCVTLIRKINLLLNKLGILDDETQERKQGNARIGSEYPRVVLRASTQRRCNAFVRVLSRMLTDSTPRCVVALSMPFKDSIIKLI